MERYAMFVNWKTQNCWSSQIDLLIKHNLNKNPSSIFDWNKQVDSKIKIEMQRTKNRQANLKKREKSRGLHCLIYYWTFYCFPCHAAGKDAACSVGDLGWEDALKKGTAHSSILAWRIPLTV